MLRLARSYAHTIIGLTRSGLDRAQIACKLLECCAIHAVLYGTEAMTVSGGFQAFRPMSTLTLQAELFSNPGCSGYMQAWKVLMFKHSASELVHSSKCWESWFQQVSSLQSSGRPAGLIPWACTGFTVMGGCLIRNWPSDCQPLGMYHYHTGVKHCVIAWMDSRLQTAC